MAGSGPFIDIHEAERFEGRVVIRRFTDQLTGADELERSTKAAQDERDEEEEREQRKRLRHLYEGSEDSTSSPEDFDVARIAREALDGVVSKFKADAKPSLLQRMKISSSKSERATAIGLLEKSVNNDADDLKVTVSTIEQKWKEGHGRIYQTFKRICRTLDDHKGVFAVFPSQNMYTSVLSASLSCLVKAAKNHSDIAEMLSDSVASISDKVATCSSFIIIIKTRRMRKRLANIYARMFEFYRNAIMWYLDSKLSRVFSSFNENLQKAYAKASDDLEDSIKELYREASVGNAAMVAMLHSEVSWLKEELQRQRQNYSKQDTSAGHRMYTLMEASWMNTRLSKGFLEAPNSNHLITYSTSSLEDGAASGMTRAEARAFSDAIKSFIIGDEGPGLFSAGGGFWLAEDEVFPKIRSWMVENEASRTMWVSSPYDPEGTTSARAAALGVVAAAWQAETPLISHFCKRPQPSEMRAGMSITQVGLVGLVHSLIVQLLQFGKAEEHLEISARTLASLNGSNEAWDTSLEVFRLLLDHTPALMYCVIDGLNDLEWGGGGEQCQQVFNILLARQKQAGSVFNILITTAGQSFVLPSNIQLKDRHITTKGPREVARYGKKVEL
ncbi:hypothetical protein F4777DRAFT_554453 [Nemania sp. FL0916]|nr:hypothetical protein F4777DRAFT_554453 [Nemania sp. FL0916]